VGKSANSITLKVGVLGDPNKGPPQKVFAAWVCSTAVSVPVVVTGDTVTLRMDDGSESPTLVTPVLLIVMPFTAGAIEIPVPAVMAKFNPGEAVGRIPLMVFTRLGVQLSGMTFEGQTNVLIVKGPTTEAEAKVYVVGKQELSRGDVHVLLEIS